MRSMIHFLFLFILTAVPLWAKSPECLKTLIIGDSQLGWNMDPLQQNSSLSLSQLKKIPRKSLGFLMFEHVLENCPSTDHQLFAQGTSGVADWMNEFHATVPFLGGSRVMLQPGSAFLVRRAALDIPENQQHNFEIPSLTQLINLYRPQKVIVALSANDWNRSAPEITELYRKFLNEVRGHVLSDADCVVQGVAGLDGRTTRSMRRPGEDISVTNQAVMKIHLAVSQAAKAERCTYVDMTSIHPTADDGIHYQGQSALEAFKLIRPYL